MTTREIPADSTVRVSIRQFKMMHQVLKESPNLSGVDLPAELSRRILDQAHSVTRSARRSTDESATSEVVFTAGGTEEGDKSPLTVERDNETVIVRASDLAAQLPLWPSAIDFITRTLGEPEVYFRTGYSASELRSTAEYLAEEVQSLRE